MAMSNSTAPLKNAALLLAVLTMTGCSFMGGAGKSEGPGPAANSTGLFPQQARITEDRILSDRQTFETVQQRLRALNEAGVPVGSYSLAKAQCWLDTAKTQYHENDRTGYVEESLTESVKIVQALEADKAAKAGYDTPLVARSTKLRDDLWAQLAGYKNQPASMVCNAKTIACAEVRLVRAGHAEEQTGWRQATPHVQMVEDALRIAKNQADNCAQPGRAAPAVAVAPVVPVPVAAAAGLGKETYVLLTDTLFKFDKSGIEDMIPGGQQRLKEVAQRLKAYKSIQTLTVNGYTDRFGSDEYNDKLSEARAKTIQTYLASLGVKSDSATAQGKGKRDPVSQNCSATAPREQQIICLQPDRRVTIEATGLMK
jgi:OOP family OmpA-OmpF porin